jgi:hypothetical protein
LRRELLKLTCLREVNFEENKGQSQRRKPEDSEGEGDTAEWGSMETALAGGGHFIKQLKIVCFTNRDGQPMYHTGHHETDHSMEEGVVVSVLVTFHFYCPLLIPCLQIVEKGFNMHISVL